MFPNINDYTYKFDQISQVDWLCSVVSKDNVKMSVNIRSGPQPPPIDYIFSLIQSKDGRKNFIIDLEEIKPAPVEEIKIESESKQESTVEGLAQAAKDFVALNGEDLLKAAGIIEPEIKEVVIESKNIDLPPEPDKVEEVKK
jgi:hypothetical protein